MGTQHVQFQGHRGQDRSEAVVQVTPDPQPLLFPGADESLAGRLQLARHLGRSRGERDLAGRVGQQFPFRGGELLGRVAAGDKQLTVDRFERKHLEVRGRDAGLDRRTTVRKCTPT